MWGHTAKLRNWSTALVENQFQTTMQELSTCVVS